SGRKKRTAQLSVQFETVELLKPKKIAGRTKKEHPASITVSIVRVKEKAESVPAEEKSIEWLLYSSEAVQNVKEALKVVEYYRARWIIEDFFRTLKSDGLKYEESELETGPALRKLFILALQAATVLLQLRQAREGTTMQKPSLVVSQDQMACLQDILPGLEGRTEKLKNPFPIDNLAWVTWIIARLGGWKGYKSQRPAGVITLRDGWVRFHHIYEGWVIAKDVYKH
ncbi:IS4 family transposase, partial [Breznakiellaceae bacterium SP9]